MKIFDWKNIWKNYWKQIIIIFSAALLLFSFSQQCGTYHKIINNIFDKWNTQVIQDYKVKQKESEEKIKSLQKEKDVLVKEITILKKEREGVDNEIANIQRPKTYEETYKRFVKSGITPLNCSCSCKR
jgi:hypothetical protein